MHGPGHRSDFLQVAELTVDLPTGCGSVLTKNRQSTSSRREEKRKMGRLLLLRSDDLPEWLIELKLDGYRAGPSNPAAG
jgi:hypothetical protein